MKKTLNIIVSFIFIFNLCHASDLVEDVIAGESNKKKISHYDLKPLINLTFHDEDRQEVLAIEKYPLSKKDDAWDNLNIFGQELDRRFFKPLGRKVIAGGVICSLFGAIVPHPSCGYLIYNIGNFLNVPILGTEDNLLIAWITISTTPAFAQQSFNIGKRLVSYIFKEDSFESSKDEGSSIPYFFKKNKIHYFSKALMLGSSAISASIPTILMNEAEKDNPLFFSITAVPFYLAWMENYYKTGSMNIDHLFEFYRYTGKINYQKRQTLKKKVLSFKREINKSNSLTQNIYTVLKDSIDNDFPSDEDSVFAFSSLFLKNLNKMPTANDGEGAALLINFKTDMEEDRYSMADDFIHWGSAALTGAGIYTKYCINQYVIHNLLMSWGATETEAYGISSGLSAFESFYRVATSNHIQKTYFRSFKKILSPIGNLNPVRKFAGISSFVNASLFSLPSLVAGLSTFSQESILSKVAYLTPAFLMDLSYYDSFFNRNYNEFITNVSTVKKNNLGIVGQRAQLNAYADKAYHYINEFDCETIEMLYQIIQKGV